MKGIKMNPSARAGFVAALVLAAMAAPGCGETVIDPSKTEDQVKASIEESPGTKVSSVDCPSGVEVEPKERFTCRVHLANGQAATATLLIRDEDANLNFVNLQADK
jgi:Domain of unknown function (DUF4333)